MTMGDEATQLAQTLAQPQEERRPAMPTKRWEVYSSSPIFLWKHEVIAGTSMTRASNVQRNLLSTLSDSVFYTEYVRN